MDNKNIKGEQVRIIIDSREQNHLFLDRRIDKLVNIRFLGCEFEIKKLDEGDYNTPELIDKIVVERKSAADLYGSINKGHIRFMDELQRARFKGKRVYIFVECSRKDFLEFCDFNKFTKRKIKTEQLNKTLDTIEEKYQPIYVWCDGRIDMEIKILNLFKLCNKLYEV